MYKILTVFGTGVSGKSFRGGQWWQRDSMFYKRVMSYLDTENFRIDWDTIPWNAGNSQQQRNEALFKVHRAIVKLEDEGYEKIVVLGHSHGGNVANSNAFIRGDHDNVSVITVGTPFAYPFIKRGFIEILRGIASLVWIEFLMSFGISSLLSSLAERQITLTVLQLKTHIGLAVKIASDHYIDNMLFLTPGLLILLLLFSFITWAGSRIYRFVKVNVYGKINNNDDFVESAMARMYVLYSRLDEVLNSLRAAPNQSIDLASKNFIRWPVFTAIYISILILCSIVASLNISIEIFKLPKPVYETLNISIVKVFSLIILPILPALYLGNLHVVLNFASSAINTLITKNFLDRAFGNDVAAITIRQMESNPMQVAWHSNPKKVSYQPLPYEFDKLINNHVDQHAVEALRHARSMLAMASMTGSESLADSVMAAIGWSELIHTSYFDIPVFADFVAWIFIERLGLPASPLYRQAVDTQEMARWFREIAPPSLHQ